MDTENDRRADQPPEPPAPPPPAVVPPMRTAPPPPPPPGPPEGLVSVSLKDGWRAFKNQPAILIIFVILTIPVTAITLTAMSGKLWWIDAIGHDGLRHFQALVWGSMLGLFECLLCAGILYAALLSLRTRPIPFTTLFSAFTRFVHMILGLVLFHLIVGIGLMFFIVPGVVFALAFSQWPLLVLDRGAEAPQALGQSWNMMRGNKAELFLLWLVLLPVNVLGLIPLGLGLIVTVPYSFAVLASFYDRLPAIHPPSA